MDTDETRTLPEYEALEQYREWIDSGYETVRIGTLRYDPSRVLEAVDPIAFRVGFSDWLGSEGIELE